MRNQRFVWAGGHGAESRVHPVTQPRLRSFYTASALLFPLVLWGRTSRCEGPLSRNTAAAVLHLQKAAFRPFVTVARRWAGFTLTVHVRPLLSYSAPGPNDRFRERAASGSLAAGLVIYQRISISPAVVPAASASTNHCGLRPRPDQVSAGFSACRYFGGAGARVVFISAPTSSASE